MKKKIVLMAVSAVLLTARGNNQKSVDDMDTVVAEEVTQDASSMNSSEDASSMNSSGDVALKTKKKKRSENKNGLYNPPFSIKVVYEKRNGGWMERDTYVYNILTNGRLSGTYTFEQKAAETNNPWEMLGEPREFGGKWSTTSISMGDGRMKVYCLDRSDSENTYYLPATCDYIWMCDRAWYYCEKWDLNRALKVTSVTRL